MNFKEPQRQLARWLEEQRTKKGIRERGKLVVMVCMVVHYFNYDYFIGLFEFVVGERICWRHHNINPGYQE
jgi:hypothetical protein